VVTEELDMADEQEDAGTGTPHDAPFRRPPRSPREHVEAVIAACLTALGVIWLTVRRCTRS
jgi:hypothetical protein